MTATVDTDTSAAGPFAPTGFSRREAYRARIESPAAVYVLRPSTTTPGWRRCHLRDVSACGAGVEAVSLDLEDGDAVLLRFGTEADGFQVRGRVVRVDAGSARTAYGVRFGGLDPRQVESLYKFVMRHAAGK
jgi:c-di-GMP-binding flagellar brake protein YcgR